MRPETLYRVRVREIAAVLDSMAELELVQHHVSRIEMRRYIALTDRQWWELVEYVKERDRAASSR